MFATAQVCHGKQESNRNSLVGLALDDMQTQMLLSISRRHCKLGVEHGRADTTPERRRRWGTISDVYFDICSAKVPYRNRSGLSTLIADMRCERFDAILVTEIWRLFGDVEVGYELSEVISSAGKFLISLDGLVDMSSGNTTLLEFYEWVHFQRLMTGKQ